MVCSTQWETMCFVFKKFSLFIFLPKYNSNKKQRPEKKRFFLTLISSAVGYMNASPWNSQLYKVCLHGTHSAWSSTVPAGISKHLQSTMQRCLLLWKQYRPLLLCCLLAGLVGSNMAKFTWLTVFCLWMGHSRWEFGSLHPALIYCP